MCGVGVSFDENLNRRRNSCLQGGVGSSKSIRSCALLDRENEWWMRKRLSRSAVVPRNESEENTHAPNIMKQFISKTELIFLSASRLSSGCISIRPMRRRDEPSDLLNFHPVLLHYRSKHERRRERERGGKKR